MAASEEALSRCSTHAPWWFRNLAIARIVVEYLEALGEYHTAKKRQAETR